MRRVSARRGGWESTNLRGLAGLLLALAALSPGRAQAACGAAPSPTLMVAARVPDLTGCSVAEARKLLIARKLRIVAGPGETIAPADIIATQDTAPDKPYPPHGIVTVGVSKATTPPPEAVADIQLVMASKEPPSVSAGSPEHYEFVVRNAGTAATRPVRLRLQVSNFEVSASAGLPEGCASLPCAFGILEPGDVRRFLVKGSAPQAGAFQLVLQADDDHDKPAEVVVHGTAIPAKKSPVDTDAHKQDTTATGHGGGHAGSDIPPAARWGALAALVAAAILAATGMHRRRVRRRWAQALRFDATLEGPAAARCGPLTPAAPPLTIAVHVETGESRVGSPLALTANRN